VLPRWLLQLTPLTSKSRTHNSSSAPSGVANINSEDDLFQDPVALTMRIDVFSERGFHVTVDVTRVCVPVRIDLQSGKIFSEEKKVFRFSVRFRSAQVRG
jgi:adenylate kinase